MITDLHIDWRAELMDAVEEGRVSPELMIISLVKYMSQDDVKDCMKVNGLLEGGTES